MSALFKDHLISMYFLFAALQEIPLIFEQMAHNGAQKVFTKTALM
jgi:hypothetical protein